jgi:hypothetical protein
MTTTVNKARTERKFIPFEKKLEIVEFLKKHARKEGGRCIYNTGWSDQRVFEHFEGSVSLWNVQDIRGKTMGKLKVFEKSNKNEGKISDRIKKLENQVSLLVEVVEELTRPSR